jgi:hypothetical protein
MAARLSTGLIKALMDTSAFKTLFTLGFIDIYSGTQPAHPDAAPTGTKLCTLYSDGSSTGLNFAEIAVGGELDKLSSETWSGTVLADGVAGWFRLRAANDPGAVSAGGTVSAAARAANAAVIVFTENGHARNVGDKVITSGFTPSAYNGHFTIIAKDTNTWSVIGTSVAGGSGDSSSVQGTYTTSTPTADAGTSSSSTAIRYDGAIATSGAEMTLGNLSMITGAPVVVSSAAFTLPNQ